MSPQHNARKPIGCLYREGDKQGSVPPLKIASPRIWWSCCMASPYWQNEVFISWWTVGQQCCSLHEHSMDLEPRLWTLPRPVEHLQWRPYNGEARCAQCAGSLEGRSRFCKCVSRVWPASLPASRRRTCASWAHLWALRSTIGSPEAESKPMASRQVSRQAAPSALQPLFSAPISFMPTQSLASHHFSSHSTCRQSGSLLRPRQACTAASLDPALDILSVPPPGLRHSFWDSHA